MTERQQRRLAAILAADIAGYSALMGADEARTVRDLKAHQAVVLPMIAQHGGRIIDTAGDGILAEFGSVVNAVECAVAIQKTMAERNATVEADRDRCNSASASTSAMSSTTRRVSTAMASTSPHGWRASQNPAASASPARCTMKFTGQIAAHLRGPRRAAAQEHRSSPCASIVSSCRTGAEAHRTTEGSAGTCRTSPRSPCFPSPT